MRKKAKSFAVEEEQYNELFNLFRENYVEISISYCINRYIKEFLEYLKSIKKELQKGASYTVPMSFIIETIAREPIFKIFDSEYSIKAETDDLQNKYNIFIKKNPEKAKDFDINSIEGKAPTKETFGLFMKMFWEEIRMRGVPDDEIPSFIRSYGEEKGIGGKEFQKGFREKFTKKSKDKKSK
jgi:hypothetical protein